jgi:hypothetical protein
VIDITLQTNPQNKRDLIQVIKSIASRKIRRRFQGKLINIKQLTNFLNFEEASTLKT